MSIELPGRCFETLRVEEGRIRHLSWHNRRCNRTRRELFGCRDMLDLGAWAPELPTRGVWRLRIDYAQEVESVELSPYAARRVRRLVPAECPGEYRYKYADRTLLDSLRRAYRHGDDLLLLRRGRILDTTIANVAFLQDGTWYTPSEPLLPGTTRARLLAEGFLVPRSIGLADLPSYEGIALMNAMIGFAPIEGGMHTLEAVP